MLMLTASTAISMSENATKQVGETKKLNLPSSFTNMFLTITKKQNLDILFIATTLIIMKANEKKPLFHS